jgi:hypothetical protein
LVASILGHGDVRLTMRHYADLRIEDGLAAMAKVPQPARPREPQNDASTGGATG